MRLINKFDLQLIKDEVDLYYKNNKKYNDFIIMSKETYNFITQNTNHHTMCSDLIQAYDYYIVKCGEFKHQIPIAISDTLEFGIVEFK